MPRGLANSRSARQKLLHLSLVQHLHTNRVVKARAEYKVFAPLCVSYGARTRYLFSCQTLNIGVSLLHVVVRMVVVTIVVVVRMRVVVTIVVMVAVVRMVVRMRVTIVVMVMMACMCTQKCLDAINSVTMTVFQS